MSQQDYVQPALMAQLARIANQLHRLTGLCPITSLSPSQIHTLAYLSSRQGEEVYQKDVEHFFRLRRSTVSSMLNGLEKKGYLRRCPVEQDARLKRLELTEGGHQIGEEMQNAAWKINDLITRGLTPEETQTFSAILAKIEDNLRET